MDLFGDTINETFGAFTGRSLKKGKRKSKKEKKATAVARIVITFVLIAIAFTLIIIEKGQDTAKVIFGAIIGYWLK